MCKAAQGGAQQGDHAADDTRAVVPLQRTGAGLVPVAVQPAKDLIGDDRVQVHVLHHLLDLIGRGCRVQERQQVGNRLEDCHVFVEQLRTAIDDKSVLSGRTRDLLDGRKVQPQPVAARRAYSSAVRVLASSLPRRPVEGARCLSLVGEAAQVLRSLLVWQLYLSRPLVVLLVPAHADEQ